MKEKNIDKKIMVIDDDSGTLHMLESILTKNGFSVTTLNFPKNALKIIKTDTPDLILLDILMPYKDGYTLCEEIKTTFSNKIPVITFTSNSYEKSYIEDAYKDFGADDFIIKPFKTVNLLKKIKNLL